MNIILVLAPLSLALAGVFVVFFFRSIEKGQFQDLETPARRILFDEKNRTPPADVSRKEKHRVSSND